MGSIIFSVVVLIISIFLLIISMNIEDLRGIDVIGSGSIPTFILSFIILLILISLISEVTEYFKTNKTLENNKINKKTMLSLIALTSLLIVFIAVLTTLGFVVSCLLILPLILITLGERNKIKVLLLTICVPIVFSLLFGLVLNIPLPRGVSIFHEISRIFY